MPIAKVQLADGRIARFEVPEGTTPQQVEAFAAQQDFGQQQPATEPAPAPTSAIAPAQPKQRTASEIAKEEISKIFDPNIERRKFLPDIFVDEEGLDVVAPSLLVDVMEIAAKFGAASKGAPITRESMLELAMEATPAGALSRLAKPAIKTAATGGAREIIEAGAREGVDVLTTDVVPPKGIIGGLARQVGEGIPILGTSGKRAAQRTQREVAVQKFVSEFPPASNDEIVASLKAQTSKVKTAAGNVIEGFKTRLTGKGDVNTQNIERAFDDAIGKLAEPGKLTDEGTMSILVKAREDFLKAPQNFGMLRENRTRIRELAESADPLGRSQLPSSSKAKLKSVEKAFTDTMDKFVLVQEGNRALRQYKNADAVWASEAQKLTKTRLKNVLDKGEITPETVETVLFSAKPSEVKLLHDSLTAEGKQAARSALISRALQKAGGEEELSPTKFASELKRLRENTGIFFKGADRARLNGLERLLKATKQAQESAVVTPTGRALQAPVALIAGSALGIPASIAIAATAGGAARLYESAAVRNLLLDLGKNRKGISVDKILARHQGAISQILASVGGPQAIRAADSNEGRSQ